MQCGNGWKEYDETNIFGCKVAYFQINKPTNQDRDSDGSQRGQKGSELRLHVAMKHSRTS